MDREGFFWKIQDGRLPVPACSITLGTLFTDVNPAAGTLRAEFEGKPEFANPAGNIQGGFIAAMLDETMGPALNAMLGAGEFAPTVDLHISFLRPAKMGRLEGHARVLRRGRDVSFVEGELHQNGKLVATATATFFTRRDNSAG